MSSESPFKRKRKEFIREPTTWQRLWTNLESAADDTFLKSIPSDDVKQFPPQYLYPIGVLILLVLFGIFLAVLVPGYEVALRTKFLAPIDSANSRYCDDVTISNTGTFLATETGDWQGSSTFAYSNATYQINLVNVQMNEEEFARSMSTIYEKLVAAGDVLKVNNLGVNLLYWMSWVQVGENRERFSMTGTPLMIFQRQHTVGTISNLAGDCNATSQGSFNPSTGMLSVSYSLAEYLTNPSCAGNGDPSQYGYSNIANSGRFDMYFDVRTVITAVAINLGVVDPQSQLQLVEHTMYNVTGVPYYSATYVDPRYPGMSPVSCLFRDDIPHCLINLGSLYGIPIFNHIGNNLTYPAQCNCTVELPKGVATMYNNTCNMFNFLTGVIVWPHPTIPLPDAALELMLSKTTQEIYDLAFAPMFTAGAYGMSSPLRDSFSSPAQRADMYEFCHSEEYGNCSIITFSSYDSAFSRNTVSTSYYNIDCGACVDTMSTTPGSWAELIETPYAPLTQGYQTCRNDPLTTFVTQVGASAGNVTLLSPAGVLLVLLILAFYQWFTGRVIPRTYSRSEKDAAIDALAVALLLVRDKRLRSADRDAGGGDVAVSGGGSNEPDVRLLNELVEQLGNIAPAMERSDLMYRREGAEPVSIDWSQLVTKVTSPLAHAAQRSRTAHGGEDHSRGRVGSGNVDSSADTELVAVRSTKV